MTYPLNSFQRKHRQKVRGRIIGTVLMLAGLGFVAVSCYHFGEDQMSARVKQQADQMHALTAERDDLHTQVVNLQADALVQKAKVTELETRYQQEIPSDTVRALMLIVKDKLAAGVTPERLTTILTAAGNVRNCREKTVKRFLLSTSLNQGKDSSASFAAGSITITGEGQMAKSEDGKAEAWFDAALPVSMKFRLIGGRVSVAEGMLPLQHSIIDDTIEYRFTIQADATSRGFVTVTSDQCDYP